MKQDIHPKYTKVTVNCANCGNAFDTRSTRNTIKVDICNNCHPFYTGKQVLVDTAGRVERFNKRFAKSAAAQAKAN
ncbi:MAG: 50S ribosomal protein L31 [Chlorobium sp.]|uniref:50S ribosomal protein L31 n=1 Tax=Chlorobium sp. TaxID=1095 RepID=UPI002F4176C5